MNGGAVGGDNDLGGRVALVTAASSGIGRACAGALVRAGARVAIVSRDEERIRAAAAELGGAGAEVLPLAADITSPGAADRLAASVREKLGPVEILVLNVGGPPPGRFDELGDEGWEEAFSGVLLPAVRFTRAVLPAMRQQRWGRIVHVLSLTVREPVAGLATSNTLRPAVAGLIADLSREVAGQGITVNGVCPGYTRTPRLEELGADAPERLRAIEASIPAGRLAAPEEIAAPVAFLCSEAASYLTGALLPVDGGLTSRP